MSGVIFGSPQAQDILRMDRACNRLDAELRKLPTDDFPFVIARQVNDVIGFISSTEAEETLYAEAFKRLLSSRRWIVYMTGGKRVDRRYQPNDEDEDL